MCWSSVCLHWRNVYFSSVQLLSRVRLFAIPWTAPQHTRPPSPSTPGVHPNPCPLSQWCYPTISSSVTPFSFCPLFFPASGSFPMSWLFTSGDQSIGVSASTSVPPMNTQDWSPLGWTHHFMANRWGNTGSSDRLYFGGLQNHCRWCDCSHEHKRCLPFERKAMTYLDNILKSRDITLLTKVHIVKAVVFPEVMYGCESWT